ncbi:Rhodanese Homology Domain [Proteiniphilum saccharofermentans]|uniref:Rhodanese Homology Domain n=1 Tax=Proteiniphilum saccharofermentans TaxID=1642647 RepID=A0A1R3T0D7_9BACT|nr:rhodanese-like domain-containing protein [Proteiniphilum saccharofermentans]SCD21201.1 Rhodanese Homology Domain [Proteiniphilum saccharofermentans]
MGFFSNVFKLTGKAELKEKIKNGAMLLDVREVEEYKSGHARGSVNIPLFLLPTEMGRLDRNTPIVVVCLSGARSAQAVGLLKSQGFEAYNGGGWQSF